MVTLKKLGALNININNTNTLFFKIWPIIFDNFMISVVINFTPPFQICRGCETFILFKNKNSVRKMVIKGPRFVVYACSGCSCVIQSLASVFSESLDVICMVYHCSDIIALDIVQPNRGHGFACVE